MKKMLLLAMAYLLTACGGAGGGLVKEVDVARSELKVARQSEANKYSKRNYSLASSLLRTAEKLLSQKELSGAKSKATDSFEKSRKAIIVSKKARTKKAIKKLAKEIKEARVYNLKQVKFEGNMNTGKEAQLKLKLMRKIRPAEKLLKEAKWSYSDAEKLAGDITGNIRSIDGGENLNAYIKKMDEAYEKTQKGLSELKEGMDEFKKEFHK